MKTNCRVLVIKTNLKDNRDPKVGFIWTHRRHSNVPASLVVSRVGALLEVCLFIEMFVLCSYTDQRPCPAALRLSSLRAYKTITTRET